MRNRSSSLQMMFLLDRLLLIVVVVLQQINESIGQQTYVNNKQLDCEKNYSNTGGYVCNGALSSCRSYLTFRSSPLYDSAATIGYLLSADASEIARINNISDVDIIPTDTLLIVPANCSCFSTSSSAATNGSVIGTSSSSNNNNSNTSYYQHNAPYILKTATETYFSVANNTYEGLTTCQSLIAQNPYNYRNLTVGMKLSVPLRCACPTSYQTDAGVRYLLTYLVTWRDTVIQIADTFGVDNQSVFDANDLSSDALIFPFTPILVPLKAEPTKINTSTTPPPPPPSPTIPVGNQSSSTSSHKWVFMGAGIGGAVLIVAFSGFLFWFFRRPHSEPKGTKATESADYTAILAGSKSWSVSSEGVRYAIGFLTVYKFEELQEATGFFGEANRIKGSVYRGSFKGDEAAVKVMKGDVSAEINILKQINHSSIIRLSGLCVHNENTYLVYEYAENGSLSDWLHSKNSRTRYSATSLGWKQRVQIAYDIADALNYLHNYASPPYIHKNLKSSNILLDGDLRAKLANFGVARTLPENQDLQLTRHVVGTHGYLAPEYIENGLVTPKLDVYAFGVVMLELLSGREATSGGRLGNKKKDEDEDEDEDEEKEKEELLSATIGPVIGGENVREKLRGFIDPSLGEKYPLDLAYSLAQLANNCVAHDDLNSRPAISEVFMTLSKVLSSSVDWDASDELDHSRSQSLG